MLLNIFLIQTNVAKYKYHIRIYFFFFFQRDETIQILFYKLLQDKIIAFFAYVVNCDYNPPKKKNKKKIHPKKKVNCDYTGKTYLQHQRFKLESLFFTVTIITFRSLLKTKKFCILKYLFFF